MRRVVTVRPLEGYRLEVSFDDGTRGAISLEDRLFGSMFAPLRDQELFRQVFIDDFGAIAWPNGADLAPDALHQRLQLSAAAT